MTFMNDPASSELIIRERDILTRIAEGGPLDTVLRDLVLLVEKPANGDMLASVLFLSADGKNLLEGAAPSLPDEYNAAIHGIPIGPEVGSCGTAAFYGRPVIVSDIANDPLWRNFRDLALKHGLRACWSVPITAADGSVLGTFANYYREPKTPNERDMEIISMVARTTAIAIERHRYDIALKREEEQRVLLLNELNHRVKNVFALTGALIHLGLRSATSAQDLAGSTLKRLNALGHAHELAMSGFPEAQKQAAPSFRSLVERILAPYSDVHDLNPIEIDGQDFELRPSAITGIALVLHELATNSVKYGSLQTGNGTLSVIWTVDDESIVLRWTESGYDCRQPTRSGVGTTLIRATVLTEFRGSLDHDWQPRGVTVTITLPLEIVA